MPIRPNSSGQSPPDDNIDYKPDIDDPTSRMSSDVALRKKKNADAQAAFRQRRANYIATLEETVTSLESVVLQLQDSCREARAEVTDLKQENARLKHELRERETMLRMWQGRKPGHAPDELSQVSSSLPSSHGQSSRMNPRISTTHGSQFGDNGLSYQPTEETSPSLNVASYSAGPSHSYPQHSPSLSYAGVDNEHLPGDGSSHAHRMSKYHPYAYPMQPSSRDGTWTQGMSQNTSSNGSPTLTSPEMYVNRFPMEDQKVPLNHLETTPYVFPGSRSISPSASTPPSSSSTSLTSPFQFTFPPDGSIPQDRPILDYNRPLNGHGPEVTLHGGTADISLSGPGSDGVRYRLGPRRANSGPERPLLPALPQFSGSENGSQHERGSSEGESNSYSLRPRRGGTASRDSRSPSPGAPPISGTLAVIKAQAFGALRRTRTRTKKSSEGAAKVAMEVLEARGIGMGVATGSKRPRLHSDDADMQP
ncbi:hypothetical protein BJ138DRAFT_1151219 [Hygrophoropsis aurantiaca]|uniref:Uncharacterized protein n=1 Tax=Hygrophoropsis aurantiaca TaxID=72124 RepID=A0ACB8AER3_9AGAM|nr:hypothetical protein BJ138DRAFT_1151219 [Hygrophoropsis aurantiaca]